MLTDDYDICTCVAVSQELHYLNQNVLIDPCEIISVLPGDNESNVTATENIRKPEVTENNVTVTEINHKLFNDFLKTDNLQFGFKKNSSCSHALFAFTESVKYFVNNSSKVYGKVLHNGLSNQRLACRQNPRPPQSRWSVSPSQNTAP